MEGDLMAWKSITDLVMDMRPHIPNIPSGLQGVRQRAAGLAAAAHGLQTVESTPALVNIAALTELMTDRIVSHRVSPGAVRLVQETDLHSLPGDAPKLLLSPWIAEVKRPDREVLFGDTVSFAAYPLDDAIYMIGLQWPDGVRTSSVCPNWRERELSLDLSEDDTSLIEDVASFSEWTREAARFAMVFAVHLEAEGSPIVTKDERSGKRERRADGPSPRRPKTWIVRRVFMDRIVRSPHSSAGTPTGDETAATDNLTESRIMVRGHMRRQPHGAGNTLRKWVYVESYEARRWTAPKPLRIDVDVWQGRGS